MPRRLPWVRLADGGFPASLLLVGASAFFGFASFFVLVVALPLYFERTLGFRIDQVGTVVGFTYVANFAAYLVVGRALDRGGGRSILAWSALGVGFTGLLYSMFSGLWSLAVVALCQGMAMSAFALAVTAIAGKVAAPEHRGRHMGVFGLFSNTSSALAPAVGMYVFRALDARALFVTAWIAGLAAAVLGLFVPADRGRFDAQSGSGSSARSWAGDARRLAVPASAVTVMGIAYGATLAFMPGLLAGRGITNPGVFYTAELITLLALRTAAGGLSDRYGRSVPVGVGLACMGFSLIVLTVARTPPVVILAGLIAGCGWASFSPAVLSWLFDRTSEDRRGLAGATYFAALDLGRVIGAIPLGFVAAQFGVTVPFVSAAILSLGAGSAFAMLIRAGSKRGA